MLASGPFVPELESMAPVLEPESGLEPESVLEGVSPPLELDPHPAIPMSVDNAIAIAEGKLDGGRCRRPTRDFISSERFKLNTTTKCGE
jgi:hypothetical protein